MMEKTEKTAFIVMLLSASLMVLLLLVFAFNGVTGNVIVEDNVAIGSAESSGTQSGSSECANGECDAVLVTSFRYVNNGGSSGGSSGLSDQSSSVSAPSTANTYSIGSIDADETVELLKDDIVSFTFSGNGYYFTVQELSPVQVKLSISGVSSSVIVKVGEAREVDLNSDGVSDISIKLKSVNIISNKAKVILNNL